MSVGEIQEQLNVPGSTLFHHIIKLMHLDLLRQERDGRILQCTANFDLLEELVCDLKDQCSVGISN